MQGQDGFLTERRSSQALPDRACYDPVFMRRFRLQLVEQLVAHPGTLSRNRNFETFADAEGQAALRSSRHLRGLEHDLLTQARTGKPARVVHTDDNGERGVRIELAALRLRRVAYLSRGEYEVLLRRPGIRAALGLPETR